MRPYALGLGFGDSARSSPTAYLYEDGLRAFPTMANVLAYPGFWMRDLDTSIDWTRVVHGEQAMTIHRPLPPGGNVIAKTRVVIWPTRGRAAARWLLPKGWCARRRAENRLRLSSRQTSAGATVVSGGIPAPTCRQAFRSVTPTLSWHSHGCEPGADLPAVGRQKPAAHQPGDSQRAGYDRPILHGLATYGIACRGIVAALCDPAG